MNQNLHIKNLYSEINMLKQELKEKKKIISKLYNIASDSQINSTIGVLSKLKKMTVWEFYKWKRENRHL